MTHLFRSNLVMTSLFLFFVLEACAHPQILNAHEVCHSLNVGHPRPLDNSRPEPGTVSINLVNSLGEASDCYNPSELYNVSINVTDKNRSIRGLLIVLDTPSHGLFPPQGAKIPAGLTASLCSYKRSFSHHCRNSDGCDYGRLLNLPYQAPDNRKINVEFRYSIVFSDRDFIENEKVIFSACPVAQPCDQADFVVPEGLKGDEENLCRPNPKNEFSETRMYTEDGVDYNCSITYKKKVCATGCMLNSKTRCCGHIIPDRMKGRNFTCIAEGKENIIREFKVPNPKGCMCYDCATVCPVPGLSSGNDESEHTTEPSIFQT